MTDYLIVYKAIDKNFNVIECNQIFSLELKPSLNDILKMKNMIMENYEFKDVTIMNIIELRSEPVA